VQAQVDGHSSGWPQLEQPSAGWVFSAGVVARHRRHSLKRDAFFFRLLIVVKRMFDQPAAHSTTAMFAKPHLQIGPPTFSSMPSPFFQINAANQTATTNFVTPRLDNN